MNGEIDVLTVAKLMFGPGAPIREIVHAHGTLFGSGSRACLVSLRGVGLFLHAVFVH